MKRAILVALMSLLCLVPGYASEVFWDPGDRPDAVITDDDFKYKYEAPTPSKSFREMDVYFTPQTMLPDWAEDLVSADRPEGAVAQERAIDVSRPAVITPPAVRPQTERQSPRIAPQPAETTPGTTPSVTTQSRRSGSRGESQVIDRSLGMGEPALTERSSTKSKKMKWGQVDVKPDDEKTKFQWGQQKQQ